MCTWRHVKSTVEPESGGLKHSQGRSLFYQASYRYNGNPDTPTPTKTEAEQTSTSQGTHWALTGHSLGTMELTMEPAEPNPEPHTHKQCSQSSLYRTVRFTTLYKKQNKTNLLTK